MHLKLINDCLIFKEGYNQINGLIETGEREELCELIDQITIASELDPKEFGDGEGLADEWRDW